MVGLLLGVICYWAVMVIIFADWVNPVGFLMLKFKGFELKYVKLKHFELKRFQLINAGKNLPHFFIFEWLK